jgi:sugar/nucleoside kinase (ribokinase family)
MGQTRIQGVLCTGNIVFDMLVHPVDQLRWGATTWVETVGQSMGGNGANTSYALACLGVPVRLLSMVGDDHFGDEMLSGLRVAGVDTRSVIRTRGATPSTIVLVRSDGNRLFLHKPGISREAFPEPVEFTPQLLHGVSLYHLANPFALPVFRAHAAETLRRARAAGLQTSLDAAWDSRGKWIEDLGPCLPNVDVLFVNEEESRMLTGLDDAHEAAKVLREAGAGTVVVKLGAKGCAVFSSSEELRVPAFEIDVLDTTGAGDCFAGAYLAALQRGCAAGEAARIANAAGALSVRRVGAVGGLLSWEDTHEWMRTARVCAS